MKYTNINDNWDNNISFHSSTRQSNVKRILMLLMIAMFMVFAGVQTTPTTNASAGCKLVCGAPFIDPNDGQCYVMCCPENPDCKSPCELRPCKQ